MALGLDERLLALKRTGECFRMILGDNDLKLQLPPEGSLAGRVLSHAVNTVENTLRKFSPMVFKLGFTTCPVTRWRNTRYGYKADRHQQWEAMTILFASHEFTGPSFLEAALIRTYKGNLMKDRDIANPFHFLDT